MRSTSFLLRYIGLCRDGGPYVPLDGLRRLCLAHTAKNTASRGTSRGTQSVRAILRRTFPLVRRGAGGRDRTDDLPLTRQLLDGDLAAYLRMQRPSRRTECRSCIQVAGFRTTFDSTLRRCIPVDQPRPQPARRRRRLTRQLRNLHPSGDAVSLARVRSAAAGCRSPSSARVAGSHPPLSPGNS